ncbi:hypothetical protein [Cohnella fermenti]|uniref:YtkA-like domain-containing protein n=1 Tax=Cohnella fermenti TaxID=2565925 RepID=A0A4S4BH09_9BACL|nr:hypothetical protein [Cohnella fermenti]THF73775.1 hypothetical protein E6C55_27680 [Cohnella fermenti]
MMRIYPSGLIKTVLVVLLAFAALTGCSASGKTTLKYSEVVLSSNPAAPVANESTKLIVQVDNPEYVDQEAEVQLQINSKSSLPSLIDATREGDNYTADYIFPSAGEYTITVHMEFEEEHYAIAKKLTVQE